VQMVHFFDVDRVEDKYMRRIKDVNKSHIFQVNADDSKFKQHVPITVRWSGGCKTGTGEEAIQEHRVD
jgi:hypothetical protein